MKICQETVKEWKKKINTNPAWAVRAALVIYSQQTQEEKDTGITLDRNGRGFNSYDDEPISNIVKEYKRNKRLNQTQVNFLMRKMPKYAKQLYVITQEKKHESLDG